MDPTMNLNEFFEDAKAAINEATLLGTQASELRTQREKAENRVNTLKRQQSEQIADAYKKRRDEIDKTYDGEITQCDAQLRKAESRRAKAKDQGIAERIDEETKDLRADIKAIQSRTRADLKANHVPEYCSSKLFTALYFPDSIGDIIIIIIMFAIAFFVIPYGIYKLLFDGSTVALIIIYILDVLLFGGIYIGMSRNTVMKHTGVLRQANANGKAIAQNRKKIKIVTEKIREDKNESYYDLAKYDDEIAHIKQQLADITMKKNDAISTFENVTKNIITDEIITNTKPAIDEAQSRLDDVTAKFNITEASRKQKAIELSDKYEVYLGKEFMNCGKIDKLQDIVNHGTATNITEAIEEYGRQYDI